MLCTGKKIAYSTKDTKTMFRDLSDLGTSAGIPAFVSSAQFKKTITPHLATKPSMGVNVCAKGNDLISLKTSPSFTC